MIHFDILGPLMVFQQRNAVLSNSPRFLYNRPLEVGGRGLGWRKRSGTATTIIIAVIIVTASIVIAAVITIVIVIVIAAVITVATRLCLLNPRMKIKNMKITYKYPCHDKEKDKN